MPEPGARPAAVTFIDELGDDPRWRDFAIPDAEPATRLLRLALDRARRASVSVVRFPAGWSRPGTGHYTVSEEFAVLDGSLQVSGVEHRPGDVVHLPASTPRWASGSSDGALTVAWFSGVPEWHTGTDDGCRAAPGGYAGRPAIGRLRAPEEGIGGGSWLAEPLDAGTATYDRDVLWLAARAWAWVPTGTPPPTLPGPALVRTWP